MREEPAPCRTHCSLRVCLFVTSELSIYFKCKINPSDFCCRGESLSWNTYRSKGVRVCVCVSPQVEPSKPLYGMPPSGSAAAPPPSSTPAYMFSHQYQRECFTRTYTPLSLHFPTTAENIWGCILLKNKTFGTEPFIFISFLFLLLQQTHDYLMWRLLTWMCFDGIFCLPETQFVLCNALIWSGITEVQLTWFLLIIWCQRMMGHLKYTGCKKTNSYNLMKTVNLLYLFYAVFCEASHPQQEWFSPSGSVHLVSMSYDASCWRLDV